MVFLLTFLFGIQGRDRWKPTCRVTPLHGGDTEQQSVSSELTKAFSCLASYRITWWDDGPSQGQSFPLSLGMEARRESVAVGSGQGSQSLGTLVSSSSKRCFKWLLGLRLSKLLFFFFFCFFWPLLQYMEVPRLGVKLELRLPAYATATATPCPSHICNLHHSSWQYQILNPLNEVRD